MQAGKILVVDTCALLPNCEGQNDPNFDIEKWRLFLKENTHFELSITPFTLYEVLSIKDEKVKDSVLEYMIANHFEVLRYRKFPGLTHKQIHSGNEWLPHLRKLIVYECNRLLEGLAADFIFSNRDINP